MPIAISALLWVGCALFVLMVPGEALVPDLIVVGLIAAGGLFFLGLLMFRRQALENEPGDAGVVEGYSVPGEPIPAINAALADPL